MEREESIWAPGAPHPVGGTGRAGAGAPVPVVPAPDGAGSLAAAIIGQVAELAEALARSAALQSGETRGAAVQAIALRRRATEAAVANDVAYRAAQAQLGERGSVATGRDAMLRAALVGSADSLLEIARAGADCAGLAAEVGRRCEAAVRVDAAGAAELATAATRVARMLIDVNLALLGGDGRRTEAAALVADAEAACGRARTQAELDATQ